jgi:hypothetical protein
MKSPEKKVQPYDKDKSIDWYDKLAEADKKFNIENFAERALKINLGKHKNGLLIREIIDVLDKLKEVASLNDD